jgi:hypothetical protein
MLSKVWRESGEFIRLKAPRALEGRTKKEKRARQDLNSRDQDLTLDVATHKGSLRPRPDLTGSTSTSR